MVKKISLLGILASLCVIFSYIEVLVPIPMGIPGIKLGLANICIVVALYKIGPVEALSVNIIRIFIVGFLFGGAAGIFYSLSGALLSFFVMRLFYKKLQVVTTALLGSLGHVTGQLLVAAIMVGMGPVAYYASYIYLSAFVSGIVIGFISDKCLGLVRIDRN